MNEMPVSICCLIGLCVFAAGCGGGGDTVNIPPGNWQDPVARATTREAFDLETARRALERFMSTSEDPILRRLAADLAEPLEPPSPSPRAPADRDNSYRYGVHVKIDLIGRAWIVTELVDRWTFLYYHGEFRTTGTGSEAVLGSRRTSNRGSR